MALFSIAVIICRFCNKNTAVTDFLKVYQSILFCVHIFKLFCYPPRNFYVEISLKISWIKVSLKFPQFPQYLARNYLQKQNLFFFLRMFFLFKRTHNVVVSMLTQFSIFHKEGVWCFKQRKVKTQMSFSCLILMGKVSCTRHKEKKGAWSQPSVELQVLKNFVFIDLQGRREGVPALVHSSHWEFPSGS